MTDPSIMEFEDLTHITTYENWNGRIYRTVFSKLLNRQVTPTELVDNIDPVLDDYLAIPRFPEV